jgi:RNA polymerase sigma-70 factor, ECF subfamily
MGGAENAAAALARMSDEELMLAATRERGSFSGSQMTPTRPEAVVARAAFDELVARHRAFAIRLATGVLPGLHDAEDVVQEVWRTLWETRTQYRVESRFVKYLSGLVVWRSCDLLRLENRHTRTSEESSALDDLPGRELSPCDAAIREEEIIRVRIAVARLPPRQQRAVRLRYYDDLTNKEIASEMDASAKGAECTLSRACASLRDLLSSESAGRRCPVQNRPSGPRRTGRGTGRHT